VNPTPDRLEAETEDDPRLIRATKEYLAELEAGRRPDRAEFVSRHPDLAGALTPYLDALDMVHGAASAAQPAPARPAADVPVPVEPLGDFHIVREIGRGGMGVVYEAVQLSLGRRVALKVLPFAAALDARQLQRFKNEAQAAAQLHHTNIVPVYAVGCERGTHYYAMQLIEGQNLADLIAEVRGADPVASRSRTAVPGTSTGSYHPASGGVDPRRGEEDHRDKPGDSPAASTAHVPAAEMATQHSTRSVRFYRTAARVAVQAAEALEHAHQFGVIHRDVKPANLIVDERGNVWVTDFGLAQFHTNQGLTRTGDMMGTLRYMSPEQAGGSHTLLDARTDVYSLGATIYELLTLRPMFDGTDSQRLLRQILNDEPRPLRAFDRTIPAELETIVLKAVSKNPSDRYATAREFADDLRRFLDNRPILARPPNVAQRLRKMARRHPSVVISAVVLCVATAIGSLVSAAMIQQAYERERKAHDEERKAHNEERERAEQAEKGLKLARQSADEMIEISEHELAGRPSTEDVRKRMLMSALAYYRGLIQLSSDDPAAQQDLDLVREHVQQILSDLAVLQGGARLDLLRRPDVKADLQANGIDLTPDQQTKLEKLDRQWKENMPDWRKLTPDERQQRLREEAHAKEAALEQVLTPLQQQRLGQIALQLKPGLLAFHDPDVAANLNLTSDQIERLRTMEAEVFLPGPEPRKGPGDPGRGFDARFRAAMDEFVAKLNDDQKKIWKSMTGEVFQSTWRPPNLRRGSPPPGPPD